MAGPRRAPGGKIYHYIGTHQSMVKQGTGSEPQPIYANIEQDSSGVLSIKYKASFSTAATGGFLIAGGKKVLSKINYIPELRSLMSDGALGSDNGEVGEVYDYLLLKGSKAVNVEPQDAYTAQAGRAFREYDERERKKAEKKSRGKGKGKVNGKTQDEDEDVEDDEVDEDDEDDENFKAARAPRQRGGGGEKKRSARLLSMLEKR